MLMNSNVLVLYHINNSQYIVIIEEEHIRNLHLIKKLIYILDYCSIYKAILTETDPTPVKSIDFIKKRLS